MIFGKYTKSNGSAICINPAHVETVEHGDGGGTIFGLASGRSVSVSEPLSVVIVDDDEPGYMIQALGDKEC